MDSFTTAFTVSYFTFTFMIIVNITFNSFIEVVVVDTAIVGTAIAINNTNFIVNCSHNLSFVKDCYNFFTFIISIIITCFVIVLIMVIKANCKDP